MKLFLLKVFMAGITLTGMVALPVHANDKVERSAGTTVSANASSNARPFSDSEVRHFLQEVRVADAISDPLMRCLAYPDPPDSHWSRAAVRAYCIYHMQSSMDDSNVKALVEGGRASELDAYLEGALEKQLTRSESAGLLDHIYFAHFSNGSAQTRALIDSWKRQLPKSAFALVASGRSYLAMAWQARGGKFASETPAENFMAMDKWLKLAVEDLNKAIAIDPRVIPAYSAMVNIGMLEGDSGFAKAAAAKGLAIQAANYSIYAQLVWMAEPKWEGSIDEMRRVVGEAQTHARDNALLKLLLPLPAAYAANLTDCNCDVPADPNAYREILDQMPSGEILAGAASAVDRADKTNLAIVYQSEVIRFSPWATAVRAGRIRHLVSFGEKVWASKEASEISAKPLSDPYTLRALAGAYISLGDTEGAGKTYARLNALPTQ
jgi:tetratricopeptide (TPR) repeat protein